MVNYSKQLRVIFIMLTVGVLTAALGYLLRIYLARTYSVAEYGMIYATISFFSLIMFFMDLGVSQSLVRIIAKYRSTNNLSAIRNSFISILFFQLLFTTITSIVIFILAPIIAPKIFHTTNLLFFKFILVWFWTTPLYTLYVSYAFSYEKPHYWSYAELLKIFLVLSITIILEYFGLGLLSAAIAFAVINIILFLIFFNKMKFMFSKKVKIRSSVFYETLKYGLLLSVGSLGWLIFSQTDTLIITYFKGLDAAGLYQVAVPIATLLSFFINPISVTVFSTISNLWFKSKQNDIDQLCSLILRYIFVLFIPSILVITLFPDTIIRLVFGDKYLAASTTLAVLSWAFGFILLSSLIYGILSAIGQAKNSAKLVLVCALGNILISLILVQILGIVGVAISTLICGAILFILLLYTLKKFINIKLPILIWLKIIFCSIIFTIIIEGLKRLLVLNYIVEAIICLFVAGIIFAMSLYALKIVSLDQIKYLRKIL